jgi:addiction module HigA family antidote
MIIRREDIESMDFSDVADTHSGKLPQVHPGEILREEFLVPLNMSVNALALALRVPATRLHEIVKERRGITLDTAMRLARYFGGDARFWLNLQTIYDLRRAEQSILDAIEREVVPRDAA